MRRTLILLALIVFVLTATSAAAGKGPITQQNGKTPVFKDFTSICGVPGYLGYGFCNGDPTTFTNVTGRINAVQAKAGRWNLGFTFTHLEPGRSYRLWGNMVPSPPIPGVIDGFFIIGTTVAALDGTARFSYQTSSPSDLGFDLNILRYPDDFHGVTLVTSYWSQQALQVLNPDGTLYVPGT